MQVAAQLIREGHYEEARILLRTIDHPKARNWLSQLDLKYPQSTSASYMPEKTQISHGRWFLALVFGFLSLASFACGAYLILIGMPLSRTFDWWLRVIIVLALTVVFRGVRQRLLR